MREKHLLEKLSKMLTWKKGTKFYAKQLGISELETKELLAKLQVDRKYKHKVVDHFGKVVHDQYRAQTYLKDEKQEENGDIIATYESTGKPLTKAEIEKLYGVDGVTSKLSTYWNKATGNGKYLTSALIKCLTPGMSLKELEAKLNKIFPKDIKPFHPKATKSPKKECLVITIADDHCGMITTTNQYNKTKFDGKVYENRLLEIVEEAVALGEFDEVHVLSLGDQLNGWNKQTTRGGHEVNSLPNDKQFDIYTKARVAFYDALFTSGISDNFYVHEMDNSNHSGLGFSYMANKFLDLYITTKYPFVLVNQNNAMSYFSYGSHIILFTHGKDEKFQKAGMPYSLNDKTDAYLMEYINAQNIRPADHHFTFYKGDLHAFGLQIGRFGRYVNVPSVAGNSDYGDLNYGNSKAGALLEIYSRDGKTVKTQPIWLDEQ